MPDFAVCGKEGLLLTWDVSLDNSEDSSLCFQQALFSVLFLFPLLIMFFVFFTVFDAVLSNIDV